MMQPWLESSHASDLGWPTFDRTGSYLFVPDEAGRLLWIELASGRTLEPSAPAPGHTLAAAGEGLVITGGRGPGRILELSPPRLRDTGLTFAPYKSLKDLALGPGPGRVSTCSFGPGVDVWSLETGLHEVFLPAPGERVSRLAGSPESDVLAWAADGERQLTFATCDGEVARAELEGKDEVRGLGCSPDGAMVAATSGSGAQLFSPDGQSLGSVSGNAAGLSALLEGWEFLSLTDEPRRLAACGMGHVLRLYRVADSQELARWTPGMLTAGMGSQGAVDPTGRYLAHVTGKKLRVLRL